MSYQSELSNQECAICRVNFNRQSRVPFIICRRNHNICQECLNGILIRGHPTCPFCREAIIARDALVNPNLYERLPGDEPLPEAYVVFKNNVNKNQPQYPGNQNQPQYPGNQNQPQYREQQVQQYEPINRLAPANVPDPDSDPQPPSGAAYRLRYPIRDFILGQMGQNGRIKRIILLSQLVLTICNFCFSLMAPQAVCSGKGNMTTFRGWLLGIAIFNCAMLCLFSIWFCYQSYQFRFPVKFYQVERFLAVILLIKTILIWGGVEAKIMIVASANGCSGVLFNYGMFLCIWNCLVMVVFIVSFCLVCLQSPQYNHQFNE